MISLTPNKVFVFIFEFYYTVSAICLLITIVTASLLQSSYLKFICHLHRSIHTALHNISHHLRNVKICSRLEAAQGPVQDQQRFNCCFPMERHLHFLRLDSTQYFMDIFYGNDKTPVMYKDVREREHSTRRSSWA